MHTPSAVRRKLRPSQPRALGGPGRRGVPGPGRRGALRGGRFLAIALVGLGGLAGPAGAATPAFQEAPGRVVFAVDTAAQSQSIATSAVALPDGEVVIGGSGTPGPQTLAPYPQASSYAAELEPDGRLDPSFGHGGIAEIPGIYPGPSELIRQPDGKLLIVGDDNETPRGS